MMEIIIPHCVESQAACLSRPDHSRIISIAFGEKINFPAEFFRPRVDGCAKLLEKCPRGEIDDCMDCIKPQRIDAKIRDPLQRVLDKVAPDFVAFRLIEIDSASPRRRVEI